MSACGYGLKDIVQLLLSYPNIELNARTNDGFTAFILACFEGHANVIKLLLSKSTIDLIASPGDVRTAFVSACRNRQKDAERRFLC